MINFIKNNSYYKYWYRRTFKLYCYIHFYTLPYYLYFFSNNKRII